MQVKEKVASLQQSLRSQWLKLREENPKLRIRNAAQKLAVSEMELLLTEPLNQVRRLEPSFGELYKELSSLGRIMMLARNDEAVHEVTATMGNFGFNKKQNMGLAVGAFDLRVFFSHWRHGYVVTDTSGKSPRHSLQFFDASGVALHKVFSVEQTNMEAWAALEKKYLADEQRPVIEMAKAVPLQRFKGWVDAEALRADWQALNDVHDFHGMLKKHQLDRLTALEHIGTDWAFPIARDSLETILQRSIEMAVPVMVFVGNRGIVQIYTGRVEKLVNIPGWFNVLDPDFNLHLQTAGVHSMWVVKRPSEDGLITSVDGFNAAGDVVFSIFGERKPGVPELKEWQALVATLESLV